MIGYFETDVGIKSVTAVSNTHPFIDDAINKKISLKYHRAGVKSIFWMHIQKTSSWIGNLLAVWACPDYCLYYIKERKIIFDGPTKNKDISDVNYFKSFDRYFKRMNISDKERSNMIARSNIMNCSVTFTNYGIGFGWHLPYMYSNMKHSIVTIFRNPMGRIISQYLFGLMIPAGNPYRESQTVEFVHNIIKHASSPIYAYVTVPGLASCQTKMMLGYFCGANYTVTHSDYMLAQTRLSELYYFGLMEESEASANLFLRMHYLDGAWPNLRRDDISKLVSPRFNFSNIRSNSDHSDETHEFLLKQLKSVGWTDYYDEALYLAASKIFYDRCRRYNIRTKHQPPSVFN